MSRPPRVFGHGVVLEPYEVDARSSSVDGQHAFHPTCFCTGPLHPSVRLPLGGQPRSSSSSSTAYGDASRLPCISSLREDSEDELAPFRSARYNHPVESVFILYNEGRQIENGLRAHDASRTKDGSSIASSLANWRPSSAASWDASYHTFFAPELRSSSLMAPSTRPPPPPDDFLYPTTAPHYDSLYPFYHHPIFLASSPNPCGYGFSEPWAPSLAPVVFPPDTSNSTCETFPHAFSHFALVSTAVQPCPVRKTRLPPSTSANRHEYLPSIQPSPFTFSPANGASPLHEGATVPPPSAILQPAAHASSALSALVEVAAAQASEDELHGGANDYPFPPLLSSSRPSSAAPLTAVTSTPEWVMDGTAQEGMAIMRAGEDQSSNWDEDHVEEVCGLWKGVDRSERLPGMRSDEPMSELSEVGETSRSGTPTPLWPIGGKTIQRDPALSRPHAPDDLADCRAHSASNTVRILIPTNRATSSVRASRGISPPAVPPPTDKDVNWELLLTPQRQTRAVNPSSCADGARSDDEILPSSSPGSVSASETEQEVLTPIEVKPRSLLKRKSTERPIIERPRATPRRKTVSLHKSAPANSTLAAKAIVAFSTWFEAHRDAPYPSPQQKASWTDTLPVTRTQVDDWFINRRRRTKLKALAKPKVGERKTARNGRRPR